MKWKIKGTGKPPTVVGNSNGNFNSPDAQMKGQGNNRTSGYPPKHSGPSPRKRAFFPMPKSYRKYGSPRGNNPLGPGGEGAQQ